jgi:4-hydroxy-2-oxoheptanedioate aldolase
MRRSKVLQKLREKKPVRMCAMGNYLPAFVSLAAHYGFDGIWLDLEHRAMQTREIQALLAFFHLYDIDCMLRPPTLEKTRLYRYLEDGATGLMIPHVSTREKAEMLVQSVKFPPLGDRGLDGAGLDCGFHVNAGPDYTDNANRETFLVVQIETPEAVVNCEAIASVPGIDALFIGPGDLGLRLSKMENPPFDLQHAVQRVSKAAETHGKAWGQPALSESHLQELVDQGATLVSYGGDFGAFRSMLERHSQLMDEIFNRNA